MRSKQKIWNWYTFLLFWTKYENPYVSELNKRATDSKTNDSSIIIDLSLLTKSHAINKNTTFLEFADSLRKIILNKSSSCLRCDITADQYFKNSLKQKIWSSRGLCSRKHSNDETKIPRDFRSNLLTNSDNKMIYMYI